MFHHILRSKKRNIYLFWILSAAMNCWFIASNWIYFWSKYMTYGQIGWADALGFGLGMLLEIPSGAIADLLGKRKTILVGLTAGAIGVPFIAFSGNFTGILIGWLITQLCFACYSGAAEALAYDTLVELKKEREYDAVIAKRVEIENITSAITVFLGGFLYVLNFRLPHILWGISFFVGACFAWFFIEPKIDTEKFSLKTYVHQLSIGFTELVQPLLRKYLGFFFVLTSIYFLYGWGLVRPAIATSFGFFAQHQSIILPAITIWGALVVGVIPWLRKRISDFQGLFFLSILMAAGFFLASFPIGYAGIIPMICIATAGELATPWISIIVNQKIQSAYRATTLSTMALLTKLPYVLVAVIVGKLIEEGKLILFTFSVSGSILFVALASVGYVAFLAFRKHRNIFL